MQNPAAILTRAADTSLTVSGAAASVRPHAGTASGQLFRDTLQTIQLPSARTGANSGAGQTRSISAAQKIAAVQQVALRHAGPQYATPAPPSPNPPTPAAASRLVPASSGTEKQPTPAGEKASARVGRIPAGMSTLWPQTEAVPGPAQTPNPQSAQLLPALPTHLPTSQLPAATAATASSVPKTAGAIDATPLAPSARNTFTAGAIAQIAQPFGRNAAAPFDGDGASGLSPAGTQTPSGLFGNDTVSGPTKSTQQNSVADASTPAVAIAPPLASMPPLASATPGAGRSSPAPYAALPPSTATLTSPAAQPANANGPGGQFPAPAAIPNPGAAQQHASAAAIATAAPGLASHIDAKPAIATVHPPVRQTAAPAEWEPTADAGSSTQGNLAATATTQPKIVSSGASNAPAERPISAPDAAQDGDDEDGQSATGTASAPQTAPTAAHPTLPAHGAPAALRADSTPTPAEAAVPDQIAQPADSQTGPRFGEPGIEPNRRTWLPNPIPGAPSRRHHPGHARPHEPARAYGRRPRHHDQPSPRFARRGTGAHRTRGRWSRHRHAAGRPARHAASRCS